MNLVTFIAVGTARAVCNLLRVRVSHCRPTSFMSTLDSAASPARVASRSPSAARPISEPADLWCLGEAGGLILQSSAVDGSIDHAVDGEAADSVADGQTEESTNGQTMGSTDGQTKVSFVGQTRISSDGLIKVSSDVGSSDMNENLKSSDCGPAPSAAEDSDSANSARASPDKAPPIDGSSAVNIDSVNIDSSTDDNAQHNQELVSNLSLDKRKREEDDESPELKKAKLETKALKAKRPGFTDERYTETSYWFENGLRKVYPYYFTFTTFTKGRWVGEKILDVFAREFRAHPAKEYERCIKAGTLTVNYQKVDIDHRLRHNDLLANVVHRHEVPITASSVPVVHLDDHMVVVDKPSSIPVHPCGRYRHNTVVFILAKEHGLKNLRTVHRLDRLTSGLLMFGRTTAKARDMELQIRTRQVTKEYVCRVEGEFPSEPIVCKLPVEVVSYKIGVCKVSPKGKECLTEFRRVSYNGTESVVFCHPHTGRMHQIRVHLQYLGYPIVNDPLYNHTVFGPNKGKGGVIDKSDEQLIADLISIHNAENWLGTDGDDQMSAQQPTAAAASSDDVTVAESADSSAVPPSANRCQANRLTASVIDRPQSDSTSPVSETNGKTNGDGLTGYQTDLMTSDEHCYECKVRYRDPRPCDLVMYLHALKYSGPGWAYETAMPDWAREHWTSPEEEKI